MSLFLIWFWSQRETTRCSPPIATFIFHWIYTRRWRETQLQNPCFRLASRAPLLLGGDVGLASLAPMLPISTYPCIRIDEVHQCTARCWSQKWSSLLLCSLGNKTPESTSEILSPSVYYYPRIVSPLNNKLLHVYSFFYIVVQSTSWLGTWYAIPWCQIMAGDRGQSAKACPK